MTVRKNSSSITKAIKDGVTFYLSTQDENNGVDIQLDMQGYTIEALQGGW